MVSDLPSSEPSIEQQPTASQPTTEEGDTTPMDYSPLPSPSRTTTMADRIEEYVCVGFLVLSQVIFVAMPLHKREPASQTLESSGEIIWNLANQEPLNGTTVPTWLLILIALIVPFILQLALTYRNTSAFHATICTYCVAIGLASIVVGFVKHYCGYLRPVYMDLCTNNNDGDGTQGDHCNLEAHLSFPSGHASHAFVGLTLLTLFLHHQWGTGNSNNNNSNTTTPLARLYSILALAPMGLATWIAASRVRDNWHFPADVIGGAVVGGSIANYVHGVWWSSLSTSTSQQQHQQFEQRQL